MRATRGRASKCRLETRIEPRGRGVQSRLQVTSDGYGMVVAFLHTPARSRWVIQQTVVPSRCVNRFPVPQDDSFQSQPRQSALWAIQSRNASAGWLSALRRPLPGPLVSGSEAIMRWRNRFVKCFVVLFEWHYIFQSQAMLCEFASSACLLSVVAIGLGGPRWRSGAAYRFR